MGSSGIVGVGRGGRGSVRERLDFGPGNFGPGFLSVWVSGGVGWASSAGFPVGTSGLNSVWDSVGASVWASVWAYVSTFFAIDHKHDYSSAMKLWEAGLVPSFDGTTWRLHSGENADVVFEWNPEVQE